MGPHSFKCGKSIEALTNKRRKHASMGPHSFKCGKLRDTQKYRETIKRLQWGRTLSSAESAVFIASNRFLCAGFNGAALFQVRKELNGKKHDQTGKNASMGPHSFKCGKSLRCARQPIAEQASMGPHSFKCGKFSARLYGARSHKCFNGAALFQVRKDDEKVRTKWRDCRASMGPHSFKCGKHTPTSKLYLELLSFNGAALFQVRKATPRAADARIIENASMGPHSFKCGKRQQSLLVKREEFFCFNGAALFQVRKVFRRRQRLASIYPASMGPHSFKCGKKRVKPLFDGYHPQLQWGRTLSSAERIKGQWRKLRQLLLQWGRTLSSAESGGRNLVRI